MERNGFGFVFKQLFGLDYPFFCNLEPWVTFCAFKIHFDHT